MAIEGAKALADVLDHAAGRAVITVTEQDASAETGAAADVAEHLAGHIARECATGMTIIIAWGRELVTLNIITHFAAGTLRAGGFFLRFWGRTCAQLRDV